MVLAISTSEDIVRMRRLVREHAIAQGFTLVDQTKIVTAASELARNILNYAGSGELGIEPVANGSKKGLKLVFSDKGPGIPDIELAMKDGYTTGGGMGLGLGGSKRLASEFHIESKVGEGTRVSLTRWR
ncbi:MAG TPA: anti-sigma regulatory factor [Burkholderiales bacterium]